MANEYTRGNLIRLRTSTPFTDDDGVIFDPSIVRVIINPPSGVQVTYVYGTDDEVTRLATGDYETLVEGNTSGRWGYRIEGEDVSGQNRGAYEDWFYVTESDFT